jgi:hypothetical protein
MEDYQRHAAAAGFRVSVVAVLAWQSCSHTALAVEAELSRLGVTADLPRSTGSYERFRAVEGLREWLLAMRGKDRQGWGVLGWQPPGPLPMWELPDLACPLAQLREIVHDLRGCVASMTGKKKRGAPRRNHARNRWIMQQRRQGKTLQVILDELTEQCVQKGWEPVSSPQAIHAIEANFKSNRKRI